MVESNRVRRPRLVLLGLAAILMAAPAARADIILGPGDQLNGHPVAAYVEQNAGGRLVAVGFQVSGAAIRDPGTSDTAVYLSLPSGAGVAGTPYTQLELDWDPQGHPPPGVYTVPHFDFHFYSIPVSVRESIAGTPTTPDPGPQFRPAGYAPPAATVPAMGGHSYDLTGPEFHGGTFTKTMLYGFYNLQEAFLEAASTQTYLESLASMGPLQTDAVIRQPSEYALPTLPALVPTSYEIAYDPAHDLYFISLRNFDTVPTVVPEPGSVGLWGMACLALGAAWRRRAWRCACRSHQAGGGVASGAAASPGAR